MSPVVAKRLLGKPSCPWLRTIALKGGREMRTRKSRQVVSPARVVFTAIQFGFFQPEQRAKEEDFFAKVSLFVYQLQSSTEFNICYVLVGMEDCKVDTTSPCSDLLQKKMKINPKLERFNCQTGFQESLTILQHHPPRYSSYHEINKFWLISLICFWLQDLDIMVWRTKTTKAFYQSYPGIFTDITTHDLLILDPQLTSLCPEKIHTDIIKVLYKPRRNRGDFRGAHFNSNI